MEIAPEDRLLTPQEVAQLFRVDPKTVTRWAKSGRLTCVWTPGGHRRFHEGPVRDLLAGEEPLTRPGPGHPVFRNAAVSVEDL